jgi:deaminated glutathione amidase
MNKVPANAPRVTVAALQMVSTSEPEANLAAAARLIERAARAGAKLVVLPEAFALFISGGQQQLGEREAGAEPLVHRFLSSQAALHRIWLVGGTVPFLEPGELRPRAACRVFDDTGAEVARYDKLHLFDVDVADGQGSYRESDTFTRGAPRSDVDGVVVVDTPFGRLGLAVCYDLRFAELFIQLRARGAQIIVVPSAFTRRTGLAHWLPLLRARAIETQCYLIGANQGGIHNEKRQTSGGSVIIDGWGAVLGEAGFGEACVTAEIDLATLEKQRAAMPVMGHRRFGITTREN